MEKQQTVLIVEDEKNIVDILRFNLQKEGYATLEAFDGVTGLRLALDENPDLILLDGEGRVIDCMRRVDAEMSAARQVLPGLFYEQPASTGRLPFLEETEEGFREKLTQAHPEVQLDRFLLDAYFGISP